MWSWRLGLSTLQELNFAAAFALSISGDVRL
jgi:hypothetical protein